MADIKSAYRDMKPAHRTAVKGLLLSVTFVALIFTIVQQSPSSGANAVYPRSTDIAIRNPHSDVAVFDKRSFGWFLGITATAIGATLALGGLIAYCVTTAVTVVGGGTCVAGAVGVALLFGALGQLIGSGAPPRLRIDESGIKMGKEDIGRNGLHKGYLPPRSLTQDEIEKQHNEEYQRLFGSDVRHVGYINANSTIHGHLIPHGYEQWPIYEFHDPKGNRVHHVRFHDKDGHLKNARMWWPDGISEDGATESERAARRMKRGGLKYNGEDFKKGGLDMNVCEAVQKQHLDKNDYAHVVDTVKCAIPMKSMKKHNGLNGQFYDSALMDTVGSVAVSVVSPMGRSQINKMKKCPSGIPTNHCSKHYTSSG